MKKILYQGYVCKFFSICSMMETYKINLETIMSKKIVRVAVVAGGLLANTIGSGAMVFAYDEYTAYPENENYGITVTMVDERNNLASLYFDEPDNPEAVFKGVKLVNGFLGDWGLDSINFTSAPWTTEYLSTSMYDGDFEEMARGEERTFTISSDLAGSDVKEAGMIYLFWNNAEEQILNTRRGRMNYSRCAESEIYLNTEEAICRAEKDEDEKLYYQPYVGWKRLNLPDETEDEREISVFKDGEWVKETINKKEENETGTDEGGGTEGDTESGGGEDGGKVDETEIRYIEKIVEVPVEKKVIEKVEVEVPVEKIVTEKVEVQVPVEKTVVDTREVVREVPVLANMVNETASATVSMDGLAEEGEAILSEEDASREDTDADIEEDASMVEGKIADPEELEVPELGKEVKKDDDLVSRIAIIAAGIISAAAILFLATVFRRKKQEENK